MAQTLEEFLVSVKYAVDQPSQQKFFDGLKRFATSIGGVVAELTALSVGLVELSAKLAQHGDALYWMSQRLETSIGSIEAASYAMAGFGVSVNDAQSAMEKLGYWQRSMGPAATQYMRTLGITSRDAAIQLEEAGKRLLALRPGSIEYAVELQRLQMMGINERQALAAGRAAPEAERNERMLAQMWGTGTGGSREQMRARLAAQTDEYGKASNQLVRSFTRMELFFETLSQKFALGLFKSIGPDIDKLNALLLQMQPHFERLMTMIIGYGPQLMAFLEGFIRATATFVDLLSETIDWIEKLPPAVKHGAEAMVELKIGMSLLASPLGRFITMFVLFMALLDDYQQWQENQKPGAHQVKTLFNWGGFDAIVKPIQAISKETDAWAEKNLGIHDFVEWLTGATVAAGLLKFSGAIGGITNSVRLLGLAFAPVMLAVEALAVAGATFALNESGKKVVYDRARALGWKVTGEDTATPQFTKDGKTIGFGAMKNTEGFDPNYGVTPGQIGGTEPKPWEPGGKNFNPSGATLKGGETLLGRLLDRLNQQFPMEPEADPTKIPTTKPDADTKSVWHSILDWGKEAAQGIGRLVEIQQDNLDMAQGLAMGVTPEAAAGSPGGVAGAGSALTGGGPMTTQQAFDAAFMRDDLMKRFAAAGHPISQEAASEIVSASKFESGLHSDIRYGGGAYDYGGTDAVGLFQETGSRHAKLERFAKEHGLDPKTYEAQIQNFMDDVLNNPVFSRGFDEALRIHNFGGHYEATSGNVHGADPWQHGRWTEQINRLPPSTANSSGATDVSRQPPRTQPNASNQQSFNYSTSITVQSPDPNLAGQKVAAEMQRIYDFQTRHAESRLA